MPFSGLTGGVLKIVGTTLPAYDGSQTRNQCHQSPQNQLRLTNPA